MISSYLAIVGLWTLAASLIWSVNTLFLIAAGLDIFEVFVANAAFTAGMVLFEIPTGVVADTAGRRHSFLLSISVLLVATVAYVWLGEIGAGVVAFSVVSLFIGLGFTFYSGAVEAGVVDALAATGHRGSLDRVFARGGYFVGTGMVVGTIVGGLLGSIDLAIPFIARIVLLGALWLVAFFAMYDIGFQSRRVPARQIPAEMSRVALAGIQYGWNRRSARLLMTMSFFQAGVLYWAFYAWPPYVVDRLGDDAVWVVGVITALMAVGLIAGNALVEITARFRVRRTTILISAAVAFSIAIIGVGVTRNVAIVSAALILMMAANGFADPVRRAYLNDIVPSEARATVLSFDSMAAGTGGVVYQIGLGAMARAISIPAAYVTGGLVALLAAPVAGRVRSLKEEADRCTGEEGEGPPACATRGIPEIIGVEIGPIAGVE